MKPDGLAAEGDWGRPAPRWVHAWAVLTVAATAVLLILGAVVTTFQVGMADPVWPTEPWYLAVAGVEWTEGQAGFLIEHTHRAAGFVVGALAVVLGVGVTLTAGSPRRWAALALLGLLVAGYGQFHREMRAVWDAKAPVTLTPGAYASLAALAGLAAVHGLAAARGDRGWGLRAVGTLAVVGVMIQGLLGGFRVMLNELFGTNLAAIHGVFAQVVFALLLCTAVLSSRRVSGLVSESVAARVRPPALLLLAVAFVQLVWGAWLRHLPGGFAQRTHMLTAFAVVGVAVWLGAAAFADPQSRRRLGLGCRVLAGLLFVQLALGVEAWIGKFSEGGVAAGMERVGVRQAVVRTAHAHTGAWVLATSAATVALAFAGKPRTAAPARRSAEGTRELAASV